MMTWVEVKDRIPHKSGVYIFKDQKMSVIYVGKAIDLYHRVASYFAKSQVMPKTSALVEKIATVETIVVESELEALILEANLIKKYLPPFNVRLTDDKDYLYIGITKEEFPKVITMRRKDLKDAKKFFGPFPSSRTVKETLKLLRRVFPWCASRDYKRACFYFHIGLCPGACAGLISKEDYGNIIRSFSKFLEGKKEELVNELITEMKKLSDEQKFEDADRIKKMIEGINYLTQVNRTHLYLENPNFLQDETNLALISLKKDLNLPKLPQRIECYDISNIGGRDATGSMVVLTRGEIDKGEYRKFKIHPPAGGVGRPNDVGMHKEMMRRRIRHGEWSIPDLFLIDGGKGQVSGISDVINGTAYENVPVFGLAKRMEWLYSKEGEIVKLSKKSLSLKLLQKIRDEAHRFAITYHRKLRGNSTFNMLS